LSVGTGLMVLVVGAIGWFLSGLAMEPVRESYQRLKQFTADASHELRNPIATIQTNVQVALADPEPDLAMQQHQLQVIERLTRRLGRLVDALLFLARQDSGMVQPGFATVVLDTLLQDVLEEQQAIATEKEITLELNIAPAETEGGFKVWGDRDQLARLLTNLVDNAVQYTPPGGQVQVSLQRTGRVHAPQLQMTVKDTGIGIPETAIPHLFDRFYQVDPARSRNKGEVLNLTTATGSGLGLAIAQAIVENHQGQIQIESELNQGTVVSVTLPVGNSTLTRTT
jgi:two-component system, OmpR family, manganese sensing sensor histidine kinase